MKSILEKLRLLDSPVIIHLPKSIEEEFQHSGYENKFKHKEKSKNTLVFIKIYLTSDKMIITRLSLKSVEQKLAGKKFMRIHKSYIIAVDKIESIQKTQLTVQGKEIPVGEGYRQTLQTYINGKNL